MLYKNVKLQRKQGFDNLGENRKERLLHLSVVKMVLLLIWIFQIRCLCKGKLCSPAPLGFGYAMQFCDIRCTFKFH